MRALLLLASLTSLACATQTSAPPRPQPIAPALPAGADRARAEALVAKPPPPGAEPWKALGPNALAVLRQIAADPAEPPSSRTHAVEGMGYLDDPQSPEALESFASDGNEIPEVRTAAAVALAVRAGPASTEAITKMLADGNPQVRLAAAHALGIIGGEHARSALQSRLDAETDAHVRDEIQKSLTKSTN